MTPRYKISGVLREVTISVGGFLLCSFSFEMTSLELFTSQRIVTNMNCFFPRFTSLQRSCFWASLIFTACWLPQELQHTTKQFPWGFRGMSHKLTCSPFEFFFLSPVLMYTAYENLRGKKINYAGQKILHECLFASGEAMAHAESAGPQYPHRYYQPHHPEVRVLHK